MVLGRPVCSYSGELQQGDPNLWAGGKNDLTLNKMWFLYIREDWSSIWTIFTLQVAASALESSLLKYSAKEHFFRWHIRLFLHLISNASFQGLPLSPVHRCIKCSACCCKVRPLNIISIKIVTYTLNHQNKVWRAVSSLWGQQRSQTDQGDSFCNGICYRNITALAMSEWALRSCW